MSTVVLEEEIIIEQVEQEKAVIEMKFPVKKCFGIADLWNIQRSKRHFSIYKNIL